MDPNLVLSALFREAFGHTADEIARLKDHASQRQIFRLKSASHSVIGVYNPNQAENRAFIGFSKHFAMKGLPVPQILHISKDELSYFESDLGDTTLMDLIEQQQEKGEAFSAKLEGIYKKVLDYLPHFQIGAARDLDYSLCYQGERFDATALLLDLNYFRESFLQKTSLKFENAKLQKEFEALASYLAKAPSDFFMYRDLQARNIMVKDREVYFIDYQSGRHGALQYDIASLLYQSRAQIPEDARQTLIQHYLSNVEKFKSIKRADFLEFLPGFVVIRLMQALGAYGKAGLMDGKQYFVQSIPFALQALRTALLHLDAPPKLDYLKELIEQIK